MVVELITSTVSSFMPRTSYLLEQNKTEEYHKLVSKVLSLTFFFCIPATAGLFILSRPVILLFSGEKYLPATATMQLLTFTIIAKTFNSFLNNLIITPQRKERFALYAQLIALFLNGVLNYFFIKKWGVFGAGLATLMVECTLPAVKLFPSWKYIKNKQNLLTTLKAFFGTIVMYAVLLILTRQIQNPFIQVLFCVCAGASVYAVIVLALKHETALLLIEGIKRKHKSRFEKQ